MPIPDVIVMGCDRTFKQKYLVSILDVNWFFRQGNSACNSFAELDFNLRGFRMKRVLDSRAVRYVEQFRDEGALIANFTDKKQASPVTIYLQQYNKHVTTDRFLTSCVEIKPRKFS